ncbi:TetR/AcrR family transcriptional regulator [Paramaledivibacter caminithermalis]|jgi:AcrR family transcriptional regulator|uniref:Transcriptional regulator, TetR family n=1 Tax=Paramaledivibacter caminithermalis (strain DSM 15212 / CIP 107654 / DViRD3) TaxID=1121301 RepID=A0A1M6P7J9_PARC5|nr:TetR/AcrR family transcriptional regulator [Paramaledivibacter caminithermalis]SHK03941.1 transcriptional regulator, TetR family [Paramaledivibacter caminithermalis DSM 15212]
MPKIIKDIEENIFKAAFELFGQYGYKETDMKKIAKNVGIAVGTLYNYYSNKKELFVSVFKKSWENTFLRIDNMLKEEIDSRDKIKILIEILYDEISKRKGLGGELIKENILTEKNSKELVFVMEGLLQRILGLLKEIRCYEDIRIKEDMEDRLALSIFMIIVELVKKYPNEKEKNLEFISQLFQNIY